MRKCIDYTNLFDVWCFEMDLGSSSIKLWRLKSNPRVLVCKSRHLYNKLVYHVTLFFFKMTSCELESSAVLGDALECAERC